MCVCTYIYTHIYMHECLEIFADVFVSIDIAIQENSLQFILRHSDRTRRNMATEFLIAEVRTGYSLHIYACLCVPAWGIV